VLEIRNSPDGARQPHLIAVTHVKTNAKESHGKRLDVIDKAITVMYEAYQPFAAVIRERGFSQHAATTQALFKVVGVSELNLRDHTIIEIPPTTVKKILTGDGKADKLAVAVAVRRLLKLPDDFVFKTDDESDACAVILAYLIAEGVIDA
jgi:crossover junction endodeoxyribonuclease RuvC